MLGRAAAIFLLLSIGTSGAAYAQAEAGRYSVRGVGFEIQFPDGWSGTPTNEAYAIVYPDGGEQDAAITVLVVDRTDTRRLMTSEVGVESGRVGIYEDEVCDSVADQIVPLGGTRVFHTVHECAGEQYSKTDTYVFFTLRNSIAVSLSAYSPEAYDRHLAAFESSLGTIKAEGAVDFRAALEIILDATSISTQDIDVEATDNQVRLTAGASSRITSIDFDEESRRISVTVDEQKRQEGHLLVPAHRLLVGPYQVHVDGEPTDDYLVIGDEGGTTQLIDVWYERGAHTVEITGTAVVPEFEAGIAIVLASILSVVLLYGRAAGLVTRQRVLTGAE